LLVVWRISTVAAQGDYTFIGDKKVIIGNNTFYTSSSLPVSNRTVILKVLPRRVGEVPEISIQIKVSSTRKRFLPDLIFLTRERDPPGVVFNLKNTNTFQDCNNTIQRQAQLFSYNPSDISCVVNKPDFNIKFNLANIHESDYGLWTLTVHWAQGDVRDRILRVFFKGLYDFMAISQTRDTWPTKLRTDVEGIKINPETGNIILGCTLNGTTPNATPELPLTMPDNYTAISYRNSTVLRLVTFHFGNRFVSSDIFERLKIGDMPICSRTTSTEEISSRIICCNDRFRSVNWPTAGTDKDKCDCYFAPKTCVKDPRPSQLIGALEVPKDILNIYPNVRCSFDDVDQNSGERNLQDLLRYTICQADENETAAFLAHNEPPHPLLVENITHLNLSAHQNAILLECRFPYSCISSDHLEKTTMTAVLHNGTEIKLNNSRVITTATHLGGHVREVYCEHYGSNSEAVKKGRQSTSDLLKTLHGDNERQHSFYNETKIGSGELYDDDQCENLASDTTIETTVLEPATAREPTKVVCRVDTLDEENNLCDNYNVSVEISSKLTTTAQSFVIDSQERSIPELRPINLHNSSADIVTILHFNNNGSGYGFGLNQVSVCEECLANGAPGDLGVINIQSNYFQLLQELISSEVYDSYQTGVESYARCYVTGKRHLTNRTKSLALSNNNVIIPIKQFLLPIPVENTTASGTLWEQTYIYIGTGLVFNRTLSFSHFHINIFGNIFMVVLCLMILLFGGCFFFFYLSKSTKVRRSRTFPSNTASSQL